MTYDDYVCKDCRFFEPIDPENGECRLNGPVYVKDITYGVWPKVKENDDWCGQYEEEIEVQ